MLTFKCLNEKEIKNTVRNDILNRWLKGLRILVSLGLNLGGIGDLLTGVTCPW